MIGTGFSGMVGVSRGGDARRGSVAARAVGGLVFAALMVGVSAAAPAGVGGAPTTNAKLRAVRDIRAATPNALPAGAVGLAPEPKPADVVYLADTGVSVVIAAGLSGDARLFDIAQPTSLSATDSTGKDLTQVGTDVEGRRRYLEVTAAPGSVPGGVGEGDIRLMLTSPAREAKSISFQFKSALTVFTGISIADLPVFPDWTLLNLAELDGEKIEMRVIDGRGGKGTLEVQFRPGAAVQRIDSVAILSGGAVKSSKGGRRSGVRKGLPGARVDEVIQVGFDVDMPVPTGADARVRLQIRTGIQSVPITVEMKNVQLP